MHQRTSECTVEFIAPPLLVPSWPYELLYRLRWRFFVWVCWLFGLGLLFFVSF